MQKNNIVETSPAFIKTDGIKSGTHVSIPANDPEMPFTGVVVKCYELGPEPQKDYAVIVQLDRKLMEIEAVKSVYPQGMMLCLSNELHVIAQPDGQTSIENRKHFMEDCLSRGWTLTGNLVCATGQMLYIFQPLNRQEEMSMVVREDGCSTMLYDRKEVYSKNVSQWLIVGY